MKDFIFRWDSAASLRSAHSAKSILGVCGHPNIEIGQNNEIFILYRVIQENTALLLHSQVRRFRKKYETIFNNNAENKPNAANLLTNTQKCQ